MTDTIKVGSPTDDRTPEQAARAAPVSLPAGSFDADALNKAFDEAAKAKNAEKRDELIADALEKHNEIGTASADLDLQPGYKRVDVVDEQLGVTENRVVFDPKAAEAAAEAPADPAPSNPASGAASPASKGE